MSATIATLPRSAGNGAALVMVVADLVMDLYAKVTAKAAPQTEVAPIALPQAAAITKPASIPAVGSVDIWRLYRLGVSGDSVSPKALAALQTRLAD